MKMISARELPPNPMHRHESNLAKIVVIEGTDSSGKEMQSKLLASAAASLGYKVGEMSFPRYSFTSPGEMLAFALGKLSQKPEQDFVGLDPLAASAIYAADRRASLPEIIDTRSKNDLLVLDRYSTSNLLHQGAKIEDPSAREIIISKITLMETEIMGLPVPDLVNYLHLPYQISMARSQRRAALTGVLADLSETNTEYLRNTSKRGLDIAMHCGWNIIDCMDGEREKSPDEIHQEILTPTIELLKPH